VDYRVQVKKIFARSEHDLDDELAKAMGCENFELLKENIIKADTEQCDRISRDIMRRYLLDKISDLYNFPVPINMLNFETKEVARQIRKEAEKLGKEFTSEIEEECTKIAEKRVRLGFIIAEIAKREGINVTRNEIFQSINAIARLYPGHEKAIWKEYSRKEALPVIVGPILENKVVEVLLGRIKVSEEVMCSYDELIAIDEEPFDFFKDDTPTENPGGPSAELASAEKILEDAAENLGEKIEEAAENLGNEVKEAGKSFLEKAEETAEKFKEKAEEAAGNVENDVKEAGKSFLEKAEEAAEKLKEKAEEAAGNIENKVKEAGKSFLERAEEAAEKLEEKVEEALGDKPNTETADSDKNEGK
jgi:ElaB/YqjD/DUF883 family membrane-anchored ribosome-binding protein